MCRVEESTSANGSGEFGFETSGVSRQSGGEPVPTPSPFIAQQLPPLSKFSGEMADEEETFAEWLEQFEMMAAACR